MPVVLGGGPAAVRAVNDALDSAGALRVALANVGLVWCLLPVPSVVRVVASVLVLGALASFVPLLLRAVRLRHRGTAGSALALQTAAGFLLTGVTIVGVGLLDPGDRAGWTIAFALLALGPVVGIGAMWALRRRPEAVRMAGGRR